MANPDFELTKKLTALFEVDFAKRDPRWMESFLATVPNAAMETEEEQVFDGPDGFPYFMLNTPEGYRSDEPLCLSQVLDHLLSEGVGIAINRAKAQPDFVFTYGDLWSLKETGTLVPMPEGPAVEAETVKEEREVLIAQPSGSFFPTYARKVIAEFLKDRVGIAKPACFLFTDAHKAPLQNLVFNIFRSQFPSPQHFTSVMQALRWFLPAQVGLISMDEDEKFTKSFVPLV